MDLSELCMLGWCVWVAVAGRGYMHGKTCSVDLDARGAQRLDVIAEEAMEDCSA